jgi:type III secretion system YscQ/HrcQ family protein
VSAAFLVELQQRIFGPLRVRGSELVPSDDTLAGFIMLSLLERLNRQLKFPVQFSFARTKNQYRADQTRGVLLSSALAVGRVTGHFRIFLPLDFLPQSGWEAAIATQDYPPDLCWTFPVSVGFLDLFPKESEQVEAGDVLLIENAVTALFPNDFSHGWTLIAEASNFRSFRVDKYFERSVGVGAQEAAVSAIKPDVSQLPIRVHVVLGEKELTLAEVQSLSPGAVLELDAIKPDCVRLMINGKVIGDGELVDVEGKLAVRVVGWRSA